MDQHVEDDRAAFARLDESHNRLEAKIDKLDSKLDTKLDVFSEKLDSTCSRILVIDTQRAGEIEQRKATKQTTGKAVGFVAGIIGACIVAAFEFVLGR